MTIYATGNALGSTDPRDLLDNAQNFDNAVNDVVNDTWVDRFGVTRKTLKGYDVEFETDQAARAAAFQAFLEGTGWSSLGAYGAGVVITSHTQTVDYLGQPYQLNPSIPASLEAPYVTTGVWATEGVNFKLVGDNSLRQDLASSTGSNQVGFNSSTVGVELSKLLARQNGLYYIADSLTSAELADVTSRTAAVDLNAKLNAWLAALPANATAVLAPGTYLNSGAVSVRFTKPITLLMEGAKFLFNSNAAEYVQLISSDIKIFELNVDGGAAWSGYTRTGAAGVRTKNAADNAPIYNIELVRPVIRRTAGAGILTGWTYLISGVRILNPLVEFTKADGISTAYSTQHVTITNPIVSDTGDDGISIVSYSSVPIPVSDVTITGARSVRSAARGFTVIGGEDISIEGRTIDATVQGVLVIQDVGTYNTYAPKRVNLNVQIYSPGGIGFEVGRNAEDIWGSAAVVESAGTRGILISGPAGQEPKRVHMSTLSASSCAATGVEFGRVIDCSASAVSANLNGTYGISAANSSILNLGTLTAVNNNATGTVGVDNINFTGVTNGSTGSTNSIDDRATPLIERTFDLASCSNLVLGPFNGVRGTVVNTLPNIQASCVNVRSTAEVVVKAGAFTAAEIPARGFGLDITNSRVYFAVAGAARYVALT